MVKNRRHKIPGMSPRSAKALGSCSTPSPTWVLNIVNAALIQPAYTSSIRDSAHKCRGGLIRSGYVRCEGCAESHHHLSRLRVSHILLQFLQDCRSRWWL